MGNTQSPPDRVTASSAAPRRRTKRQFESNWTGWLFIAPVMIGIVTLQIGPIIASLFVSFTDWDGLTQASWIGLGNYSRLTRDPLFEKTLWNTVIFTLGAVPLTVVVALFLAVLLETPKLIGRTLFRTVLFTPYVTSAVAIGLVWSEFYAPDGTLNSILANFGIDGPNWLTDLNFAMPAVIVVAVWQGMGYPMVILLAGLQNIPTSLYEAALLDRAGRWRQFWSITLPLLTPHLFFVIIVQFIMSFQVFAIIYVMTGGGPGNATNILIYYLYQTAFTFGRIGYASAMAWVLFLIIGLVTFFQWRLQKRWVFYGT